MTLLINLNYTNMDINNIMQGKWDVILRYDSFPLLIHIKTDDEHWLLKWCDAIDNYRFQIWMLYNVDKIWTLLKSEHLSLLQSIPESVYILTYDFENKKLNIKIPNRIEEKNRYELPEDYFPIGHISIYGKDLEKVYK